MFFIFQGADFIGLVIVIIYIGAIAMLFLYTIMLFDPRYAHTRQRKRSPKLKLFKIFLLFYFLSLLPWARGTALDFITDSYDYWYDYDLFETNIDVIAYFLYNKYS
jgi:NADH:ubiquinone oxidoreductase subunit 6 (subunit J)